MIGKIRNNIEENQAQKKVLKSTRYLPLFVSVVFTQRKIPLLGLSLPLSVSVMVCH